MLEFDSAQIEKAALLYDVGKFILRTQGEIETNFEKVGAEFLAPFFKDADKKILDCIAANDPLLVESDALASGTNRRTVDRKVSKKLENIFNIFGNAGKNSVFDLRLLKNDEINLPEVDDNENLSKKYNEILNEFKNYLKKFPLNECSPNDIAQILETVWSYVPAGTAENELSDISLYDHAKLTAVYAVCLQKYLQENGNVTDFEKLRGEEVFLLVSGDISGIQQFIYTIPSKGALKSLRGRSFYLEILLENIADEILTAVGVSRNCLIYTGGGHFYLLLPNTEEVQKILKNFSDTINDWFLKHFGSRLYLAIAWTPSTALEFIGETENGTGEPFRRVSEALSKNKLQRYNENQLLKMFNPQNSINKTLDGSKECGICRNSSKKLIPYYNDKDDTLACESCCNLYVMGQKMLNCDGFIVAKKFFENNYDESLPLPNDLSLYPLIKGKEKPVAKIVRTYVKKRSDIEIGTIGIWLADYVTRGENDEVLNFEELASLSGGDKNSEGIKRLGVMRADVDNLGAAFMAGFPANYSTLTRTATLSRQLAHFFKHIMIFICKGKVTEKFQLFNVDKKILRNVHVVYSGGDDVFLVGAWDDLIELAVDIRRIFEQFTNDKLTFSAGIGFFQPKFPVAELARKTGILEDVAKDNPGKNSIALFGAPTAMKSKEIKSAQSYSWKIFTEKVCGEKLNFLLENFNFDTSVQVEDKLTLGKSGLYRILSFLADTNSELQSVNLARFAYLLARLNPGENKNGSKVYSKIRDKFYFWYKDLQERKELRTAIELIIYSMREKEEN